MYRILLAVCLVATVAVAQQTTACQSNQIFNGQTCTCAPGYFSSTSDESRSQCKDECEEVYFSFFTYGKCVDDIFGRIAREQQPTCNLRCGVRLHLWTSIGIFLLFASAIASLVFTIPMCIATCCSCLQAKKANKNSKRVYLETQTNGSSTKVGEDSQAVATMGYSPYAYWPYYGRA